MSEGASLERRIADSTSDGWSIVVPEAHVAAARRWLLLGLATLAGSTLFAALMVAGRVAGSGELFRIALAVHIDLAVPGWLLACGGLLWTLRDGDRAPWGRRCWWAAALGTALLVVASLTAAPPQLNTFLPVLRHPLYLIGLGLLGVGVAARAFLCLEAGLDAAHRNPVSAGMFLAAVAVVLAAFTLVRTGMRLPQVADPALRTELLFWPVGHVLPFAYSALALVAWLWLAVGTGLRLGVPPRVPMLVILSGVLPFLAVALVELTTNVGTADQHDAYARLARWGAGWPLLPIGLLVLVGVLRGPAADHEDGPARGSLYGSLLLIGCGFALDFGFGGALAGIPVRYLGIVGGATLALMGLVYRLLPALGYAAVPSHLGRWQPLLYGGGALLHSAGLAGSQLAGQSGAVVRRSAILLSEIGWLVTVLGTLLFLWLCYRSIFPGRTPPAA